MFESLEQRRMMAVLSGTDLQITATENSDVVRVSMNDAQTIRVEENGVVSFFNNANVASVHVDLKAGNDTFEVLTNASGTPSQPMTITGGDGKDSITGGAGRDSIDGGAGDDVIHGGGGSDKLNGGDGNNQLFGDAGNDSLTGGLGADNFDGGDGLDTADYSTRTHNISVTIDDVANDGELINKTGTKLVGGVQTVFTLAVSEGDNVHLNVENVTTGSGNDSIIGNVANVANKFIGGAGNDKLRGRAGNDTLLGGDGNDILVGAGQNDLLSGQAGDDQIFGGAGADDIRGGDGNDVIDGGVGSDAILGNAGDDVILSADNEVDNVDGGAGNDILDADANDVFSNVEITDF